MLSYLPTGTPTNGSYFTPSGSYFTPKNEETNPKDVVTTFPNISNNELLRQSSVKAPSTSLWISPSQIIKTPRSPTSPSVIQNSNPSNYSMIKPATALFPPVPHYPSFSLYPSPNVIQHSPVSASPKSHATVMFPHRSESGDKKSGAYHRFNIGSDLVEAMNRKNALIECSGLLAILDREITATRNGEALEPRSKKFNTLVNELSVDMQKKQTFCQDLTFHFLA